MSDMMSMMIPRTPKRKPAKRKSAKPKLDKKRPDYTALRLYTFCNFYLSSIQQGIQSAHVVSELYDTYMALDGDEDRMLAMWGAHHKTIIVCNGGMGQDVVDGFRLLEPLAQGVYPICSFNEEAAAFGAMMDDVHTGDLVGPMTAFGIVLPNTVYEAKPCWSKISGHARKTGAWEFGVHGVDYHKWSATSIEAQIMEYVSSKSLAR